MTIFSPETGEGPWVPPLFFIGFRSFLLQITLSGNIIVNEISWFFGFVEKVVSAGTGLAVIYLCQRDNKLNQT